MKVSRGKPHGNPKKIHDKKQKKRWGFLEPEVRAISHGSYELASWALQQAEVASPQLSG